jgi:hypothetical protein
VGIQGSIILDQAPTSTLETTHLKILQSSQFRAKITKIKIQNKYPSFRRDARHLEFTHLKIERFLWSVRRISQAVT